MTARFQKRASRLFAFLALFFCVGCAAGPSHGPLGTWYPPPQAGAYQINGFRLTLTTGVPVTTTDVTGAGTLYLTPAMSGSGQIGLYINGAWQLVTSAQVSLSLTLTSGKNYDVFAYYSSGGVLTLVLSNQWTNDTTRADALATQDGAQVLSSDHTRRWLGTLRASGTNTTEDSVAKRFLWNAYNQRSRTMKVTESTDSWTYGTTPVFS